MARGVLAHLFCTTILLGIKTVAWGQDRPACPVDASWRLVDGVSDEFGASRLDDSKWDDWAASFPGRRASGKVGDKCEDGFRFTSKNVSVRNGELVLTARLLEDVEMTREIAYLRHAPYATSIVKSKQKVLYGYFETRAKTMKACVSNAFWLYDPHSDNPVVKFREGDVSEEIDIFEVCGKADHFDSHHDETKTYFNTVHFYCTPYLEGVVNFKKEDRKPRSFKTKVCFGFAEDYHVYGLLWTKEKIQWFLDGGVVAERANNGDFVRPLHVTLDSEVFATWFGRPDPADLPAEFKVDYVRVWQQPVTEVE